MDDHKVLEKIWAKFQTRAIRRASDNVLLTYYGFFDVNGNGVWNPGTDLDRNSPNTCNVTTSAGLIATGNGQCGAWAEFLCEILKSQGLNGINGIGNRLVALEVKGQPQNVGFAVKSWSKTGTSPRKIIDTDAGIDGSSPTIPDPRKNEAADALGVPGQGTSPNPPSGFRNHFILKLNGRYYDPSYGLGPFADRKVYEISAFEGPIRRAGINLFLRDAPPSDGDPNNRVDEIIDYVEVPCQ